MPLTPISRAFTRLGRRSFIKYVNRSRTSRLTTTMEKPPIAERVEPLPARRSRRLVATRVAAVTILSFILLNKLFSDSFNSINLSENLDTVTPLTFEWSKIVPSPDLKWHACGERRECARLELPMDHLDPEGDKIAVAVVRIPATEKEYRGPILFNPGGPGGSGVMFANEIGDILQQIIGGEYDIVGFDPRGIGATTPKVSTFLDDTERALWDAGGTQLLNRSSDALLWTYSRAGLFGQLASARSKHISEYVGTAAVARDMLNITNAFGFEKLKYWGFSYGTVLGGTFAAMFPDYVDRLIIDGVVEFSDYYSGRWYSNLVDTDKILDYIFDACVAAGKDCPLYESTPSQVGARVEAIFDSLKQQPIPAFNGTDYIILDYGNVKSVLFTGLYDPFQKIGPFFDALAALERGDVEPMLLRVTASKEAPPKCGGVPKSSAIPNSLPEGGDAVRCGEGQGVGVTLDDLQRHIEELGELSVFGDLWSEIRVQCSGWTLKAKERYGGDFHTTTSFPLLIIGNTLDPVTPLFAAKKASEGFNNSVLLTVDTPGHCSIAGTSIPALKYIRDYFRDGSLPPVGTVCPIVNKLFVKNGTEGLPLNLNEEEREFMELGKKLGQGINEARKGYYL